MPRQSGDNDLGAAYARLHQSLRSYLRRRIPDATHAEDLLQEVFVKALVSERAGLRIENLTGWLFAVARTALADYFRTTGTRTQELDGNIPEKEAADDTRLHEEISNCVALFVAHLPPIYRDTLVATDLQGEKFRSYAARQGVSVSAIKSRAARGRSMLKEKLLECCHVEMTEGLVSDYHRTSPSRCGEKCA